ncbi:hypothetical protein [Sphingobacterium ginsenosidimutans]|uniref:Uncharacterized protein n=2 Tax=Sphingobacterium TaxID=28453 RepID=A0ABP8A5K8_9SPHI
MKKILHAVMALIALMTMAGACSPEKYALGEIDLSPAQLTEGKSYRIEHDANNPNIVYLTSLMDPKYTALWEHPQGRSQDKKVTLKMPFPGEYTVKFGVETRGGVVYGEPVSFKIDAMYAEFISDETWTLLTGGAGQEKTWFLDLDAAGVSRHFKGPMYFYGTGDWWGTVNKTGEPLNSDSWSWEPDWKGNSWLMPAGDYGRMTFDLKGGANVNVNHAMLGKVQKGVFNIDTEKKTMRMTGASPLHGKPQDGIVVDWGDVRIMSLTKNTMQLAVLRDPVLSNDGAAMLTFNFISKEYKESLDQGGSESGPAK